MKITLFDKDPTAQSFQPGQVVFKEGDTADVMYALQSGTVEIIYMGKLLDTLEAGSIFGEMALIEPTPRIATAIAKTETRLVAIDKKRFLFLIQQTPFFALQLMAIMADRLRRMNAKLG